MGLLAESSSAATTDAPMVLGGSVHTANGVLITGQDLAAGTVLGRITASGKLTIADQDGVNGSQIPVGILVHACDAGDADADCQYYYSGEFNSDLLVWDAGFTAALQKSAFDGTPIAIKELL